MIKLQQTVTQFNLPAIKYFYRILQRPYRRLLDMIQKQIQSIQKAAIIFETADNDEGQLFSKCIRYKFVFGYRYFYFLSLPYQFIANYNINQMINPESRENLFEFDMLLDMKQEVTLCPETLEEFPDDILFQQQNIMCYSSRGGHIHNEDKFDFIINDDYILAAVYDGHGGSTVSLYLKENLLKNIIQHKDFHFQPQNSISECIKNIQEQVISKFSETTGSTLAIVLWKKDQLIVANVGDTLCLGFQSEISKLNKLKTNTSFQNFQQDNFEKIEHQYSKIQLCEMHNLQNQNQRNKVRKMGGSIFKGKNTYRVSGQLNLSRSIGDRKYKKWISSQPYIKKYQNNFTNIVLASDGFTKKLQPLMNPSQIQALVQSMPYFKDNSTLIMIGKPCFTA